MKRKFLKFLLTVFVALMAFFVLGLTSCKGEKEEQGAQYAVVVVVDGDGGSASADKTVVEAGKNVTFTFTPNEHYELAEVVVNGRKVETSQNAYVHENANADVNVTVSFQKIAYSVTAEENLTGGRILLDTTQATYGEKVKFSVLPERGYLVDKVVINATQYGANEYPSEIEISGETTISATFTQAQVVTMNIPAFSGDNEITITFLDGSIPSDGKFYVGERVLVTIITEDNFRVKWVTVNGKEQGLNSVNAFSIELKENFTVEVNIAEILIATFYDGDKKVGECEFLSGDAVRKVDVVLPGYHVETWHENKDLTDEAFNFEIARTQSVNLYMKKEANAYEVTLHSNTPLNETQTQSHVYDAEKTLPVNEFKNQGWFFVGWSTTKNGGVEITDAQSVKNLTTEQDANVNLYAVWESIVLPDSYDVEIGESCELTFTIAYLNISDLVVEWQLASTDKCTLSSANQAIGIAKGEKYGLENEVNVRVTYKGETIEGSSVINVWEKGAKCYVLVSTAEEFKAVNFEKYNARLTANIDLGDLNDSTGYVQFTKTSPILTENGEGKTTMKCLFPLLSKHLDGNGYSLEYGQYTWWGADLALFGVVSGTVSNLKVVSNARTCIGSGAFAGHGWSTALIENCEFTVNDSNAAATTGERGLFVRFGGTMKNCILYVNVKYAAGDICSDYNAIAAGPTCIRNTETYQYATFQDVVVVAPEIQQVYGAGQETNTINGVTVYNAETDMLVSHNFTGWKDSLWKFKKEGDVITGLVFGNENEKAPEIPVEWVEISSEAEFKALNGQRGYYYLTKDLTFYVNGDSTNSNGWAVVHTFNGTLDGRGFTINYKSAANGENTQWSQAFIYNLNGKICNLNFVATVNISPNSAVFAMILGKGSEISNCTFDITTKNNSAGVDSTYETTSASFCSVIRANVTVKNVIIKATAYKSDGTTANTVMSVFSKDAPDATATFENVVIVADQARNLTGADIQPSGLTSYATVKAMYSEYDFSSWEDSVWVIEKEGNAVIGITLKK